MVRGIRSARMLVTVLGYSDNDTPRSPVKKLPNQRPNRTSAWIVQAHRLPHPLPHLGRDVRVGKHAIGNVPRHRRQDQEQQRLENEQGDQNLKKAREDVFAHPASLTPQPQKSRGKWRTTSPHLVSQRRPEGYWTAWTIPCKP